MRLAEGSQATAAQLSGATVTGVVATSASLSQANATPPVLTAENGAAHSNLQAVVREHAVITSDDLVAMKFNTAEVFIPTEFTDQPVVNPALCDTGCEAEARSAAGMSHVRDNEWESQFRAARMDLASDRVWGHAYADGMQRLHSYCVFQDQAKKAFPRGSGASETQRAEWAEYVGQMNASLGGGVDSSAARIQEQIQQTQRQDSVRAAIMEVLAERAFSQCSASAR